MNVFGTWQCRLINCNLLLNIGPLPNGEVHSEDITTLRSVGKRIREEGWPEPMPDVKTEKIVDGLVVV